MHFYIFIIEQDLKSEDFSESFLDLQFESHFQTQIHLTKFQNLIQ